MIMKDMDSCVETLPDYVCTRRKAKILGIKPPSLVDVCASDKNTNKRHSYQSFKESCEDRPFSQEDMFSAYSSVSISLKSTNRNEEMLQKFENETWIQCDAVPCQKWRLVQSDDIKEIGAAKWFCSMNKDPLRNTCNSLEEDYTAYDKLAQKIGVKYVYSEIEEGTLVWAKLAGYCRWPALITKDPEGTISVLSDENGNPQSYHVEFLGEPHSHGWVGSHSISVYGHRENKEDNSVITSETSSLKNGTKRRKFGKKHKANPKKPLLETYKRENVTVAIAEADSMLHWNYDLRLANCRFKTETKQQRTTQPGGNTLDHHMYDFNDENQNHSNVQNNHASNDHFDKKIPDNGKFIDRRRKCINSSTNGQSNDEGQTPCKPTSSKPSHQQNFMNFDSTLLNKTKEEKLTFDIEKVAQEQYTRGGVEQLVQKTTLSFMKIYRRNEKAFEHDVRRFLDRHGLRIKQLPLWQNIPIPLFQLFSVVFDQGGYYQVCERRGWSKVYRELTDHPTSIAGTRAKTYYYKNLLSYELYLRGKDYELVLSNVRQSGKEKQKTCKPQKHSPENTDSHSSSDDDDLEAMLTTLEETSHLCHMQDQFNTADLPGEPSILAVHVPDGLGVMFHDDSPVIPFSPGIKLADTASEFGHANLPDDSPFTNEDSSDDDTDEEEERLLQDLQNVKQQIDDLTQELVMEE